MITARTATSELRFVMRDGKRILQQLISYQKVLEMPKYLWEDVPLESEDE